MDITQIIIIVSLLAFVIVGYVVKKSSMESYSDFTMNKGKLGWFTIAAGISMTYAGGAAILTTASIGYTFKWYSLVDPSALMLGLLIVMFFYKKYENDKGTTISDLLSSSHKGITVLIGIVTSFTFVLIVAANFVALSKLLSPYFPTINPLIITFLLSSLVFSYVFLGGFNSVTKTDILQYVLITLFLVLPLLLFAIKNKGLLPSDNLTHSFSIMPIDYIILFSIPILFTPLSQDVNLRIKSAKSSKHGKYGLIMGGVFYFAIALSAAYVGVFLGNTNIELNDPEQSIPVFFKNSFPKLGFMAIIASLAAIVSTLDSYILNSMTSISNDIIKPILKNNTNIPKTIKFAALITYIIAMAIALFFNKVLVLSLTSLLIYISVLIPIAFGNLIHLSGRLVFIGSLINISVLLLIEILALPITPKAVAYPLFGCVVISLIRFIEFLKYERD